MFTRIRYGVIVTWMAGLLLLGGSHAWGQGGKMITFCLDPLNMPYSQQFAQPPGFDMEIGGLIAEFLQRESGIFWADTGTRGGLGRAMRNSINAGQCNAFMGIVSDPRQDAELEEKGLVLTAPYMAVSMVVIVREDSPKIIQVGDLAAIRPAIQAGTISHGVMIRKRWKHGLHRFLDQALEAVASKESSVALLFGPKAGWSMMQNFQGRGISISKDFVPEPDLLWSLGIAVHKDDPQLKQDLERAIDQLITENKIAPILEKYGVPWIDPRNR